MMDRDLLQRAAGPTLELSAIGFERLQLFADLVKKWNPAINVVARSTLDDLWNRHFADSVQLLACATPEHRLWLDLGSGGGFPGLVVAAIAADALPELRVELVESDKRKAVFLAEVIRQLGLKATVHAVRVETLAKRDACVVSARALAALATLCGYAARHIRTDGVCAFLKGASAQLEVAEARRQWQFDLLQIESATDGRSSVLFLRGLQHV